MSKKLFVVVGSLTFLILSLQMSTVAQDGGDAIAAGGKKSDQSSGNVPDSLESRQSLASPNDKEMTFGRRSVNELAIAAKIQKQIKKLAQSKTENDDRVVIRDIRQQLDELFSAMAVRREKEIDVLEKRIKELRQLNRERENDRNRLIASKLEWIVNDTKKEREAPDH